MARTRETARKIPTKTAVQKRGKKEKHTAKSTKPAKPARSAKPANGGKHIVRRILAQDGEKYLMDWIPSWEDVTIIDDPENAQALVDWNDNKKAKLTFTFDGRTVLRSTNPTEDDADITVRAMMDKIFRHFRNFMRGDPGDMAALLFPDHDWAFATEADANTAVNIFNSTAHLRQTAPPTSAAETMRRTYVQMRTLHQTTFRATDLTYAAISIKYLGQIDPNLETLSADTPNRTPQSPLQHLAPLFAHEYKDINPRKWATPAHLHTALLPLHNLATSFITSAPYILAHPQALLFTRLFYTSDALAPLLRAATGVRLTSSWPDHSRDACLYAYMQQAGDSRAVDCVERTYLAARDGVMWAVKDAGDDHDDNVQGERAGEAQGVYVVLIESEDE
ncbi:hypothetical protein BDU57DRAFT_582160 [Ampelomyces quisqualis]|uniref:Uncharacterized protein n=1 Tax=Ampelomyces quisqualis TaxID=50730 RepID=A0A6A5QDH0_AMPQU|nr:hypothetical protein BDU57DRAFT_582160 [Ampelomyces quisqualis]